jgi:hypothetical protein
MDYCSIHRLPECLSLRRNRVPPPLQDSVSPPLNSKKGGGKQHSRAGEGVGGPNSDDLIESLVQCILCDTEVRLCILLILCAVQCTKLYIYCTVYIQQVDTVPVIHIFISVPLAVGLPNTFIKKI